MALLFERGFGQLTGVYGALMAGATYVPMDTRHSEDRWQELLEMTSPVALLAHHTITPERSTVPACCAMLHLAPEGPTLCWEAPEQAVSTVTVLRHTFSLSDSHCLTLSHTISHYLTLSLTVSHYLSLSHTISLYLTLSHTISLYLTLSHSIPHYLSLSHTFSLTVSHHLTLSHTVSDYLSHCHTILHYLSHCLTHCHTVLLLQERLPSQAENSAAEDCYVLFTSGTTGKPKGAFTHLLHLIIAHCTQSQFAFSMRALITALLQEYESLTG